MQHLIATSRGRIGPEAVGDIWGKRSKRREAVNGRKEPFSTDAAQRANVCFAVPVTQRFFAVLRKVPTLRWYDPSDRCTHSERKTGSAAMIFRMILGSITGLLMGVATGWLNRAGFAGGSNS